MADTALVLLHGALGAADQMAPLRARLDLDAPIVVPDLPGHGARADAAWTMDAFADDVRARIADAGCARAVIFGYSMGGYVALHLAAIAPDVVRAVGTLGTKLAWTPEVAAREVRQLDPAAIRAKVPRFADLLAGRHGDGRWEAVLAGTAALLRALGERPPVTLATLATISCPVRLAVGDRDATVTLDETRDAVAALAHGQLEVLPGTGHPFERAPLDDATLGAVRCPVRVLVGDRDATVSVEETASAYRALVAGELAVLPATPHPLERAPLGRVALGVRELWARAAG